ncbi:hypothetical protein VKA52_11050 [Halobacillus sp. HZG1]|uniref:hypothetical protein n=1 Tax=Halobacillus sp. HZG1 TaxID=3111769 RepID=UPI002DB9BC16|nr:hypothetical protein [Halobacillus sp. HZG1]MEC3884265.1 hypothetical protein [Halobacillus sp. HZG1]
MRKDMVSIFKRFLPPTATMVHFATPESKSALIITDLEGDGVTEIAGIYYWRGENYLMILKQGPGGWYIADTKKGKGYGVKYLGVVPLKNRNEYNILVGWQVGSIWSDLSVYEWGNDGVTDLIEGNQYFSMIDVEDMEGKQGRDGLYEVALWKHDTGLAYNVEVFRWGHDGFERAEDVYPAYFKKVERYYSSLLREYNSSTYWYYIADAQIKTGRKREAYKSITHALDFEYPYPSRDKLLNLRRDLCDVEPFSNQKGIDFSSLTYVCSQTERDLKLEAAVEKEYNVKLSEENIRYYYNRIDLNNDGNKEVFVFLVGSFVCGTGGCSAVIFKEMEGEYQVLSRFSLVRNPVIVSNTTTNGYRDLIMYVAGGGIEDFFAHIKFDGQTYPLNPSVQPIVASGTKVEGEAIVADDLAKSKGIQINET